MLINRPILITTGEPAGIGMDIVLDLAHQGFFKSLSHPVVVTACAKAMTERFRLLYGSNNHHDCSIEQLIKKNGCEWHTISSIDNVKNGDQNGFYLLDIPTPVSVAAGTIDSANATMVLKQLEVAHHLAINNTVIGIVTAPLQKSALIDANLTLPDGTMFSGHTEYFMQMSQCKKVVMMLANSKLKVALVTTHLPLSQVAKAITRDEVRETVQIVLSSLQTQFGIVKPKVLVCGLNPHAGEGGHLGTEEIEIINPVLQEFIDQEFDISLAMPADTLFTTRYLSDCDATIAMYHDQGLPVLKSHGFGDSVNLTLGLPYIRTSVDHGTALDLAGGKGTGQVSSDSLKQAVKMLTSMAVKHKAF